MRLQNIKIVFYIVLIWLFAAALPGIAWASGLIIPNNIVHYANLSISNSESSATVNGLQVMIPFNGMIADAQVYNATLTNAEVNAIYEGGIGGAPVAPANLIGWWKLNGTINGNVIDYSGQNNEGTPTAITYASPTNAPYGSFTVNLINTVSGQANTLIGQDDGIVTFSFHQPIKLAGATGAPPIPPSYMALTSAFVSVALYT